MLAIYDRTSLKAQKFQESKELKTRDEKNRQDRLENLREKDLLLK